MKSFLTFIIIVFFGQQTFSQEGAPISINKQFYIYGNTAVIGNNIVSKHETEPFNNRDVINDEVKMKYVDIDADEATFSSSQATLTIPENSTKIVYAALYWSAIYKYDKGVLRREGKKKIYKGNESNRDTNINEIRLKLPNSSYKDIKGEIIYDDLNKKVFPNNTPYACFADITNLLNQTKQVNGEYTVANIKATQGFISGGCSGGWFLYVVYEAPSDHPIYVTTYNGFIQVNKQNPSTIIFKDFKTQEKGFVKTNLTLATLEGDHKLKSDQCLVLNPKDSSYVALGNLIRRDKNFFNSKITFNEDEFENRKPYSKNTLGFDLLQMQLPNPNNDLISNNVDEITMKIKTKGDRFYLFFSAFQTDISDINYIQNRENKLVNEIATEENKILEKNTDQEINATKSTKTEVDEVKIKEQPKTKVKPYSKEVKKVLQSNSITIPDEESGYYLVTNVFSKHRNTESWIAFLESKGHSPKVFTNPKNNWEYVYVSDSENIELVYNSYKEIYKLSYLKNIWIFKINLP